MEAGAVGIKQRLQVHIICNLQYVFNNYNIHPEILCHHTCSVTA